MSNFQSHVDTVIELSPGINLIVGTSNIGKSSFLRAINLLLHNEVPNREFVTHGAKNAVVRGEFSDGTVVERVKGVKNSYYLIRPDGTDELFDRVGTEIPREVYEAMGCPPIDKHHGPISYAEQLSPLFLVSLTPTELPRAISHLTGCDDFERAAALLGQRARQFDRDIKSSNERLTKMEAQLAQYDGLDEKLSLCGTLGDRLDNVEEGLALSVVAGGIIEEYAEVMEDGKRTNQLLKRSESVVALKPRVGELAERLRLLEGARELLDEYREASNEISRAEKSLEAADKVARLKLENRLQGMSELAVKVARAGELLAEYSQVNADGRRLKQEIDQHVASRDEAQSELEALRSDLAASGVLCESCGQVIANG